MGQTLISIFGNMPCFDFDHDEEPFWIYLTPLQTTREPQNTLTPVFLIPSSNPSLSETPPEFFLTTNTSIYSVYILYIFLTLFFFPTFNVTKELKIYLTKSIKKM